MMNDGMLSQDEIDALLRGMDDSDHVPALHDIFTPLEQDAIGEIGNISFGSSATALSTLLNQKVEITTPSVSVVERKRVADEFPRPYVAIQVNYTEGFLGTNLLVIEQQDAAVIADLMLGGDGTTADSSLGEIQLSAVQEAMNQMMGSAATSMSTIFNKRVDISPPTLHLLDLTEGKGLEYLPDEDFFIKVSFRLKIGALVDSNIMQLLPIDFAKELVTHLLGSSAEAAGTLEKEENIDPSSAGAVPREELQPAPAYAHASDGEFSSAASRFTNEPVGGRSKEEESVAERHIQAADFAEFDDPPLAATEARNLELLFDVPLQVTVELGRTKRSVQEILQLSAGSIIELDKLAGEPVDIFVNNKLIAKGEVVVIDENFGVRITDIVSQNDRLKRLK
ncbi:flagellar motor switch phosphatase FliY [Geobacillus thermodenitrificans]|uniref:Flagellar motor switch phosphatase FliY n=2 Tax=Geobacillus thermodenitrificans TaxID=33940 RepID=A0ABY9QFT0_GEOTD|nr:MULTISPECIES: flagellar motor switch phosphatase FliY [Geobacillus]ARP42218.1 Flagellar motor switch protein FliN [Geobacillus thermodenitrificans]ATO36441.1 flagellar motor switch phosphatase FliY [Geobacillus thermodenitrificans]OQP11229.1 flagellar motor switch phosphatase FliY [Geobacillus sp. 47C-IIb]QNU30876.1 flagellar motor switch phosphatase FliY [Geobacillus sp. 47C-IIb]WMV77416.1 flagellar motor switch phosphatase FliY [Geobacillus thermodenitrificans]